MTDSTPSIATRQKNARTVLSKVIFPFTINHHETLFGGQALSWMDETAFIAATRFCRKQLVTVSSNNVQFEKPISAGSLIEMVAEITRVGRTSLTVQVSVHVEDMYADGREQAITGEFSFVAVDDNKQPIPLMQGLEETT